VEEALKALSAAGVSSAPVVDSSEDNLLDKYRGFFDALDACVLLSAAQDTKELNALRKRTLGTWNGGWRGNRVWTVAVYAEVNTRG
jgi:hypothetical protein